MSEQGKEEQEKKEKREEQEESTSTYNHRKNNEEAKELRIDEHESIEKAISTVDDIIKRKLKSFDSLEDKCKFMEEIRKEIILQKQFVEFEYCMHKWKIPMEEKKASMNSEVQHMETEIGVLCNSIKYTCIESTLNDGKCKVAFRMVLPNEKKNYWNGHYEGDATIENIILFKSDSNIFSDAKDHSLQFTFESDTTNFMEFKKDFHIKTLTDTDLRLFFMCVCNPYRIHLF